MIKILNLFSGFAFIIFGYNALHMIPEFRNYIGQELVAWFIFYALMFCLTFIVWTLTYFYMRDVDDDLDDLEDRLERIERNPTGYEKCDKQMEFELWQND